MILQLDMGGIFGDLDRCDAISLELAARRCSKMDAFV